MSIHANQNQIRKMVESWAESIRAGDTEGIIANRTEDVLMFDVPEPLQSKGIESSKKREESGSSRMNITRRRTRLAAEINSASPGRSPRISHGKSMKATIAPRRMNIALFGMKKIDVEILRKACKGE